MKWFKHDVDMHSDLKVQLLMEKHGLEGYGIYNICLEMVGKEGIKGKIDGQLRWIQLLCKMIGWSNEDKIREILSTMAELKLICPKSFKYGNLYIPKFLKRADDYTLRKLRTNSEHSTDNVHLEEKRIDKKRIEEIITFYGSKKGMVFKEKDSLYWQYFKRNGRAAKALLTLCDVEPAKKAIIGIGTLLEKMGKDWSLETIVKWYPDYAIKGDNLWSKNERKERCDF